MTVRDLGGFVDGESSAAPRPARGVVMLLETPIMDTATRVLLVGRRVIGPAVAMFALVLCTGGCERSPARPEVRSTTPQPARPNIIFVLVDTLRADRVGVYGRRLPSLTPTIDEVAAEGVTFERAIAQAPWTQPSIASMFTSYNPSVHQVFSYEAAAVELSPYEHHTVTVLADEFQTLAECLKAGGYVTAGSVANPVILPEYGFRQGFDHYDTTFADLSNQMSGDGVNEAAITWLKQRDTSKPFFLYLHYMDVHGPYNSGPQFVDDLLDAVEKNPNKRLLTPVERSRLGYLGKLPRNCPNPQRHFRLTRFREYWVARYESGIREFDYHFASLRAKLSEMGLWDEAYVIITADHGEALCEHGLWSHGYTTHHSDLHVPLILRWPGKLPPGNGQLPAGKRVSDTVRLIDVMPTLLAQLSLQQSADWPVQGVSLLPLISGHPFSEPLRAFAEGVKSGPKQQALYQDEWKLILTLETGRRQLFNPYDDYDEQIDLSARETERLDALSVMLRKQAEVNEQLATNVATSRVTVPAEQVERLKSLGYVGD